MKPLLLALALLIPISTLAGEPKVSVHLLDHTGEKRTKSRFWIDWSESWRGIVESKVVTGKEADEIITMLRTSLKTTEAAHFCGHDPIYGIEADDGEGRVLKTSLCFKCLTWVLPGRRLDIAGKTGIENELCRKLREVIELPEDVRKEGPL